VGDCCESRVTYYKYSKKGKMNLLNPNAPTEICGDILEGAVFGRDPCRRCIERGRRTWVVGHTFKRWRKI